ncbi:MAG: SagB/ThcOx family dehydrogenase [Bryobacterales bacterium]|nr:SagB/ThcOx family dehydrogenase [Bryobacterales bacterium]
MHSWRDYHERTKHTPDGLRQASPALDWANMPDLFREYEGVPVLDLPADPPEPGMGGVADGAERLSQLFFYSAANSAAKQTATGRRYALRVNPSSGNLHPTEFHFITGGLANWPDGVYHYRCSAHMAEQRATAIAQPGLQVVLTSVAWREAWKYGDRAYRYCLLDAGHAAEALRLAAQASGCPAEVNAGFNDVAVAEALHLPDDEWPLVQVNVNAPPGGIAWQAIEKPAGTPGQLSRNPLRSEGIEAIHRLTSALSPAPWRWPASPGPLSLGDAMSFGKAARSRRSALDFRQGDETLSPAQLGLLLAVANPGLITLYLYIHRVEGIAPGLYRYDPHAGELTPLRAGDQRVAIAGLSLRQDLAGNACLALSMVADLDTAARTYGDRGYRYAHFEAGAIGQRLYLAATALGLGATGIGGFFDDATHRYLGIAPQQGQVVYHFALGHPVPDHRLTP